MAAWDDWEDIALATKEADVGQVQHYIKGVDKPPPLSDEDDMKGSCAGAWRHAIDAEKVFTTLSRREFISRFIGAISALDRPSGHPDRLKGRGECTVLVAHRGSGKSFLFHALIRAGICATKRTIFVYLNYATDDKEPPVQLFCKLMMEKVKGTRVADSIAAVRNVDDLVQWLERRNLRVALLVDEVESVFAMENAALAERIQSQFIAFGELDKHPPIVAFLAGSSLRIRRLCFIKYALEDARADGFVSYNRARDFNGRKYVAEVLDLIHTKEELIGAINSMGLWGTLASPHSGLSASGDAKPAADDDGSVFFPQPRKSHEEVLFQLFLHTRGVAQAIKDELGGETTAMMDFMNLKRKDGTLHTLWSALLEAIRAAMGEKRYEDLLSQLRGGTFPTYELPWVRQETLNSHCDGAKAVLTAKLMWDYADKGFLRVQVESASEMSPDALLVTFAHISDLWWAVRSLVPSQSRREHR